MSLGWNFDISTAPRGKYVVEERRFGKTKADTRRFVPARVILATKCGKVTVSHYLPDENRWMMLAKGEQPVAWQPYPEHPHSSAPIPSPALTDKPEAAAVVSGTHSARVQP